MPPPLSQHDGPAGIAAAAAAAATHNTTLLLQIGKLWPATAEINACCFLAFPPRVTVDSVLMVHLGVSICTDHPNAVL